MSPVGSPSWTTWPPPHHQMWARRPFFGLPSTFAISRTDHPVYLHFSVDRIACWTVSFRRVGVLSTVPHTKRYLVNTCNKGVKENV